MEITVEPARIEDAGELMTVQRAAFLIEGELNNSFTLPPLTETLDEVRAAIESDTEVLVARLGHRIVGSVRGTAVDGTGHVGRLSVAPDMHGRGIGRMLMAAIETALADRVARYQLFTGATSQNNLRMYRRLGYTDLGWRPAPAAPGLAYLEKPV